MKIFGRRVEGLDLLVLGIGVLVLLGAISTFAAFLALGDSRQRIWFLLGAVALLILGLALVRWSHVFPSKRREPPAIDG
ncbi:MAG TPA: hypothetical protein VF235_03905 [Actinomycetota bacterium]